MSEEETPKQDGYHAEFVLGGNSIYLEKILPKHAQYENLLGWLLTGMYGMNKQVSMKSVSPIKLNGYSWRADGQLVEFEFTGKIRVAMRVTETSWDVEEGGSKE